MARPSAVVCAWYVGYLVVRLPTLTACIVMYLETGAAAAALGTCHACDIAPVATHATERAHRVSRRPQREIWHGVELAQRCGLFQQRIRAAARHEKFADSGRRTLHSAVCGYRRSLRIVRRLEHNVRNRRLCRATRGRNGVGVTRAWEARRAELQQAPVAPVARKCASTRGCPTSATGRCSSGGLHARAGAQRQRSAVRRSGGHGSCCVCFTWEGASSRPMGVEFVAAVRAALLRANSVF